MAQRKIDHKISHGDSGGGEARNGGNNLRGSTYSVYRFSAGRHMEHNDVETIVPSQQSTVLQHSTAQSQHSHSIVEVMSKPSYSHCTVPLPEAAGENDVEVQRALYRLGLGLDFIA